MVVIWVGFSKLSRVVLFEYIMVPHVIISHLFFLGFGKGCVLVHSLAELVCPILLSPIQEIL